MKKVTIYHGRNKLDPEFLQYTTNWFLKWRQKHTFNCKFCNVDVTKPIEGKCMVVINSVVMCDKCYKTFVN